MDARHGRQEQKRIIWVVRFHEPIEQQNESLSLNTVSTDANVNVNHKLVLLQL